MKKYTQAQLRQLVRLGVAEDYTNKPADRVKCPEMLRAAETLAAFILAQKSPIDKAAAGQYNNAKE